MFLKYPVSLEFTFPSPLNTFEAISSSLPVVSANIALNAFLFESSYSCIAAQYSLPFSKLFFFHILNHVFFQRESIFEPEVRFVLFSQSEFTRARRKAAEIRRTDLSISIQSIASFKGDLSTLTAPPFLLSPQSVTEYSAYWAEHPILFVAAAKEDDPQKRALCVLQWFLSTLKEQHSNLDESGKKKRAMKPLNAFLGEQFLGKWVDEAGTTELVSEQVRWVFML
jgi:hypothetical protein